MRRAWRNFMRKHIRPISQEYALISKRNLSIAYAFFAWNAAAFLMFSVMRHQFPMTEEEKKKPGKYLLEISIFLHDTKIIIFS